MIYNIQFFFLSFGGTLARLTGFNKNKGIGRIIRDLIPFTPPNDLKLTSKQLQNAIDFTWIGKQAYYMTAHCCNKLFIYLIPYLNT